MLNPYLEAGVAREQHRDFVRQSEQHRLVRTVHAASQLHRRPAAERGRRILGRLISRALVWVSAFTGRPITTG